MDNQTMNLLRAFQGGIFLFFFLPRQTHPRRDGVPEPAALVPEPLLPASPATPPASAVVDLSPGCGGRTRASAPSGSSRHVQASGEEERERERARKKEVVSSRHRCGGSVGSVVITTASVTLQICRILMKCCEKTGAQPVKATTWSFMVIHLHSNQILQYTLYFLNFL